MGKLKNITAVTLASTMILTGQSVFAEQNDSKISVVVDGSELTFDTQPVIENGRVLVPFRKIFEALNCAVSYRSNGTSKEVVAVNGEKFITAEIGSNTMSVNGEEIKLDAPARIDNGRTLVPLRAVSESLNADVQWSGAERKVTINKKAGFYKISSVSSDETVKADDGTNIAYISVVYPVIEGSSDFVKKINSEYKAQAEKFVSSVKTEFAEDAKLLYKEMGSSYRPMEFTLSYEVNTNREGIVSITNFDYENTNGAHPNYSKSSRTFNMTDEKELQLIDVLAGEQEGLEQTVYDGFLKYLEDNDPSIDAETAENLGSKLNDVNWYLTDNSLVMYYNPYEIAPYALGAPTIEIKPENDSTLNIYLPGENSKEEADEEISDKLDIELPDSTDGYSWNVMGIDADKIQLTDSYDKSEDTKTSGIYKAEIKGLEEGKTELDFIYTDAEGNMAKKVTYTVEISKDKKIKVVNKVEA